MNLTDLLVDSGGSASIGRLAGTVGLRESQANELIGALAPALIAGLKNQTQTSGLSRLQSALAGGKHQRYLEQPELMQATATREDGDKILGHIFGSKQVSRIVAARAAGQTGLEASVIKKALPLVAGLAMAALSKNTAGGDVTAGNGRLGELLGSLAGDGKDSAIDDLLQLAKKIF